MSTLTQQQIDRAKPEGEQYFLRCRKYRGLALRVTPQGAKSFVWEGRIKRTKTKYRLTLGSADPASTRAMSLDDARTRASEINASIRKGHDPFAEEQAEQERADAEWTLADLWGEFLKRHVATLAQGTQRNYRSDFGSHMPAEWLKRKLSSFTRDEIVRLHYRVGDGKEKIINGRTRKTGGKIAANRVIELLRKMFNFAIDCGRLTTGPNPCARIKRNRENPREGFYKAAELARLSAALENEPEHWRTYFALTLMLGTRKMELLTAKWSYVDWETQTLTLPMTKSGHAVAKILTEEASTILMKWRESSKKLFGESEWIFPSTRSPRGYMTGAQKAWTRIRVAAGVTGKNAVIHTLRHSTASYLAMAGLNVTTIQNLLGHRQLRTTEGYMHHSVDALREAQKTVAPKLRLLLSARSSKKAEPDAYDMMAALVTAEAKIETGTPAKAA